MSWDNNGGGDFGSSEPQQQEQSSYERPPRSEPTEEQMARRNYNWASNRTRYEFNGNAVDENGMAPRDSTLEAELFEENSAEQQTQLDFSKYEKIPVRVERGAAPRPIKTVKYKLATFFLLFITKNKYFFFQPLKISHENISLMRQILILS
jgi:hypothetical protein